MKSCHAPVAIGEDRGRAVADTVHPVPANGDTNLMAAAAEASEAAVRLAVDAARAGRRSTSMDAPVRVSMDEWKLFMRNAKRLPCLLESMKQHEMAQIGDSIMISRKETPCIGEYWERFLQTDVVSVFVRKTIAVGDMPIADDVKRYLEDINALLVAYNNNDTKRAFFKLSLNLLPFVNNANLNSIALTNIQQIDVQCSIVVAHSAKQIRLANCTFVDHGKALCQHLIKAGRDVETLDISRCPKIYYRNKVLELSKIRSFRLGHIPIAMGWMESAAKNRHIRKLVIAGVTIRNARDYERTQALIATTSARELRFFHWCFHASHDEENWILQALQRNHNIESLNLVAAMTQYDWQRDIDPVLRRNKQRNKWLDTVPHTSRDDNCLAVFVKALQRHSALRDDSEYIFESLRNGHLQFHVLASSRQRIVGKQQ